MKVETISYLKKHAANLPLDEPMTITQNGKPAYVIESYEERKKRDEAVALMKLLSFSVDDANNGRVMSSSDFKQKLAKRRANSEKSDNDQASTG
ncbi:type II toxin-antitoxin system Phd/YefM family antitoxin [Photobacterium halotolerans]|uniref:Type II toxin-antitoxin system Phd/YefM family antitoxin n=1 Tax=Photobacterium halotolerans TaxID=265726 RepID=A0A7X5AU31_9GAMM|nr:type II toxin-antitoxin system Phd/YefM family antitoxin [Photobacterium halotolerans]NAW66527.1 type II toxin-antitoxin system Phd/YefM family antitoxin [Photobacterium halotolerans]NAX47401.1 type II toxin-antitoxin system Phd/YefM family antitoxin [Photobacterium halotolerans]